MNLNYFDYQLFVFINSLAGKLTVLNPLMVILANDALFLFPVGMLLYWLSSQAKNWKLLFQSIISAGAGLTLSFILGAIFYRNRPFVNHHVYQLIKHSADASFPSDHTTAAFAVAMTFVLLGVRYRRLWVILATLIGFSRVWSGVHYPTDILAGVLLGTFSATIVHIMMRKIKVLRLAISS